jgi:hypothetical protein
VHTPEGGVRLPRRGHFNAPLTAPTWGGPPCHCPDGGAHP